MVTREAFRAAVARGKARRAAGPVALAARFDRRRKRIVIDLGKGVELVFAPEQIEGLSRAAPRELDAIEITPSGLGLHFPRLDADLYLPALIEGVTGSAGWMAKETQTARPGAPRRDGRRGRRSTLAAE